jgi:putative DNA primase/helicase
VSDDGGVIPIGSKDLQRALIYSELSDLGNAERFTALHGRDARYSSPERRWYVWDGRRWAADRRLTVEQWAKNAIRTALEASTKCKSDRRSDLVKHLQASESNGHIRGLLERARAERNIPIEPEEFDTHPMLLNCANGVLDLETGELRAHDRALLLSKLIPVEYPSEVATCPRWLWFLQRVLDKDAELIAYLQRAIGYSLTGDTREGCLHFLYGGGRNGKSTFLRLLAALLGDYSVEADFTTFTHDATRVGPESNQLARLAGTRLVRAVEPEEGRRLNESLVKLLTGEDTITARHLYAEPFEFVPMFKLWFAGNHKPVIRGTDLAIWSRIRLIPFTVTIPEEERDGHLLTKLRAELPGILRWAVEGCQQWLAAGLQAPAAVLTATSEYQADSDVVGRFLVECCVRQETAEATSGELYNRFKTWADNGNEYVLPIQRFSQKLDEHGLLARKRHGSMVREGVMLKV